MKIPWKRIGLGALKIISLGSALDGKDNSHLDLLVSLIEGVEHAMPDSPGADKKATVEAMSDAAITSLVAAGKLSTEKANQIRTVRSRYIDLLVKIKNLEAEAEAAWDEAQALLKD